MHKARIILKRIFYTILSSRFPTFSLQNWLICLYRKLWPTSITVYMYICGHIVYRIGLWNSTKRVAFIQRPYDLYFSFGQQKKVWPTPATQRRHAVYFFWQLAKLNGAPSIQIRHIVRRISHLSNIIYIYTYVCILCTYTVKFLAAIWQLVLAL